MSVPAGVSRRSDDCSVYMQLGDFHLPKAVHVADTGSVTGRVFSQADLDSLSTGTTRDPMYLAARNAHLLISTKQNAARIRIRSFMAVPAGEPGTRKALPAKLIFLDTDYELLKARLQDVFPGAAGIERMVDKEVREALTGPQKLALLLAETELVVLTASDVKEQDRTEPCCD